MNQRRPTRVQLVVGHAAICRGYAIPTHPRAHNGLIAGSSPAGPISEISELFRSSSPSPAGAAPDSCRIVAACLSSPEAQYLLSAKTDGPACPSPQGWKNNARKRVEDSRAETYGQEREGPATKEPAPNCWPFLVEALREFAQLLQPLRANPGRVRSRPVGD